MKKNRIASFLIVFVIYILASILGIVIYNFLDYGFVLNLLIADVIATVFVFIFSLLLNNASVYDPYWSVQPIVIVIALMFKNSISSASLVPSIAVILWGIRLTINWAYTFKSLEHQDWRYTMLQKKTKAMYPIVNFLGIHMVPTIIVYLCILPLAYLYEYPNDTSILSIIFVLISCFAFTIQAISDVEMHKFRKKKEGNFIRNGLWKYSRHPNYLGEIMMWWGIGLSVLSVLPNHYFLLIGAFLNTLLFLFISIPMAEEHQRSRKEGFDQYKKETRMLLPIKK